MCLSPIVTQQMIFNDLEDVLVACRNCEECVRQQMGYSTSYGNEIESAQGLSNFPLDNDDDGDYPYPF